MSTRKPTLLPRYVTKMEIVGENIKLARKRRGITTNQLSERADIARSTLYLIEKGDYGVSIGSYINVLRCLGLQDDIFNVAKDDEFGRRLQDLLLLEKPETQSTQLKESKRIYGRIRLGLIKGYYNSHIEDVVGKTVNDLIIYLNSNKYGFKYGDEFIHIDHIIPLDSIETHEQIETLNHFTNLQLLPSEYNVGVKNNKKWDQDHFDNWFANI